MHYQSFGVSKFHRRFPMTIINDSKATNPSATLAAINSTPGDKVLILSGEPKFDYDADWMREILSNCTAVYATGGLSQNRHVFPEEFWPQLVFYAYLKDAVMDALKRAEGGTLLFSPSAASFDEFSNYMEQGMPLMSTSIVQSKRHFIDWWLFVPMVLLLIIGYIMVFSTTSFKGLSEFNDAYYFIKQHSFFLLGGMVLFFIGAALPTKKIKQGALIGYALSIGLLLVTLIPSIGVQIGGASRWLNVFEVSISACGSRKVLVGDCG